MSDNSKIELTRTGVIVGAPSKKAAGRLLDGHTHDELPSEVTQ